MANVPQLSDEDWQELHERLTLYAACRLVRRSWYGFRVKRTKGVVAKGHGPEDLASDAIVAFLEGTRSWNEQRYPELFEFLKSVVDSRINALVRSKENRETRRVEPTDADDSTADERTFLSREGRPDELVEDAEWKNRFRDAMAKELAEDSVCQGLFEGLSAGFSNDEIASLLDISVSDVYNAQKRLNRRIEAVMKKFDDGRRS